MDRYNPICVYNDDEQCYEAKIGDFAVINGEWVKYSEAQREIEWLRAGIITGISMFHYI